MGDVTAVNMDVITEKSGHQMVPMAVSVCITPAAPAPLPLPYPVVATSAEGIVDPAMRTKVNGSPLATVGSALKACHGNEPGTLKEVVSLNNGGPVFLVMGAPTVLCELGMIGITGSPGFSNKAVEAGAGANASDAGGTGGAGGGGGGGGSAPGEPGSSNNSPSNSGGSGGGGSNSGASASPAKAAKDKTPAEKTPAPTDEERKLAAESNKDPDDGKNNARGNARFKVVNHQLTNNTTTPEPDPVHGGSYDRPLTQDEVHAAGVNVHYGKPVTSMQDPDGIMYTNHTFVKPNGGQPGYILNDGSTDADGKK